MRLIDLLPEAIQDQVYDPYSDTISDRLPFSGYNDFFEPDTNSFFNQWFFQTYADYDVKEVIARFHRAHSDTYRELVEVLDAYVNRTCRGEFSALYNLLAKNDASVFNNELIDTYNEQMSVDTTRTITRGGTEKVEGKSTGTFTGSHSTSSDDNTSEYQAAFGSYEGGTADNGLQLTDMQKKATSSSDSSTSSDGNTNNSTTTRNLTDKDIVSDERVKTTTNKHQAMLNLDLWERGVSALSTFNIFNKMADIIGRAVFDTIQ